MYKPRFVTRIRVLVAVCVLVALVIIGRLYTLQIVRGDLYLARAEAQATSQTSPLLLRDSIYFSDKAGNLVIAATVQNSTSSSQGKRYYPGGSLAAQEIGFVAYNNDDDQKGRYGLERYYEQTLAREEELSYSNFFVELFGAAKSVFGVKPRTGDLITTLEPVVQAELERTLDEYDDEWNPRLAGGIIMDPKTGEIVAMAVTPTFDLNEFNKEDNALIFANPLVENVYEMGSIIKPLTMAAGLDSGAITPNTTYNDTGEITLDEKTIRNYDGVARGPNTPMQEILSQSLNLGVSFISVQMGKDTMREYFLDKFKLGSETGIDLPGELHGLVENLESPRQVEYSTASFGQGIAITPIQTVRALATLANGGVLVTPHLVRSVRYDAGYTQTLSWGQGERALSEKTTREVSRMLTEVVDDALANGDVKLDHYSVAAKTGTAQIANPNGGGYYADRFLHSFFGYFPSYDSRFIIFLFASEPVGAPYASQTWTQPFHELTQFLISYYDIPPDR